MSSKAVEALREELQKAELKVIEIKKMINSFSSMEGESIPFPGIEGAVSFSGGGAGVQPDSFFGKGLSTAVKQYLKMKGRAATTPEILEVLKRGGFQFPETWKKKEDFIRLLALGLAKNTHDFVRVPMGNENAFGLWEFYPEKMKEREKKQQPDEDKEEAKEKTTKAVKPNAKDAKNSKKGGNSKSSKKEEVKSEPTAEATDKV